MESEEELIVFRERVVATFFIFFASVFFDNPCLFKHLNKIYSEVYIGLLSTFFKSTLVECCLLFLGLKALLDPSNKNYFKFEVGFIKIQF